MEHNSRQRPDSKDVVGSPTSIEGRPYQTLDDYLAKLERDGWVGKPWYKEVRPGLYELVTNLKPAPTTRLFTRAELARKFGFKH